MIVMHTSFAEITDEMLDQYILPELLPFWEKLGKTFNVPNEFLEDNLATHRPS